jgi:hypothetical protein
MDHHQSLQWHSYTVAVQHDGRARGRRRRHHAAAAIGQPLIHPALQSAMIFPLVVLVAVLPGLAAVNSWDLTPPGPMWGIRGLAVLDGLLLDQMPAIDMIRSVHEAAAFRAVAYQPPLYAWLEAVGFWFSVDRNPLVSVLPSYLAGVLTVMLVYLHGCLWRGAGLGLTAALLVGFNHNLLLRMQEATPTTLVVAGILATLLGYGWHERVVLESAHPRWWAGPSVWAIGSGLALGFALLALSGVALIVVPIALLHQQYLRAVSIPSAQQPCSRLWWPSWRERIDLLDGLLSLAVALTVSLPWFGLMLEAHGWQAMRALVVPPDGLLADHQLSLVPRLIMLAPVTLPLGLFGAIRAIRLALVDEANTCNACGGALWIIWLGVGALTPSIWPTGPQSVYDLLLLVPLSLLAAHTIADLVNRQVSIRALIGLAPITALSVAWWASADLNEALGDVVHGRADAATAVGLHLALDLILVFLWIIRMLNRWAHGHDERQRWILRAFLVAALVVIIIAGLQEVLFRHSETHDLLSLRTMILRRNREIPFHTVTVVGSARSAPPRTGADPMAHRALPGGRLRFILRTALPHLAQLDLNTIDDLFSLPEGQRLVVLAGTGQRISSADQFKLGLEAIHPGRSGILDAYATARSRIPRR